MLLQELYVKEYLKYFYYTDILTDEEYFHKVHHGFYKQLLTEGPQSAICEECKKPFQFVEHINYRIPRSNTGARSAMKNAAERNVYTWYINNTGICRIRL